MLWICLERHTTLKDTDSTRGSLTQPSLGCSIEEDALANEQLARLYSLAVAYVSKAIIRVMCTCGIMQICQKNQPQD